ncbi:MAG: outer membrane protein assembly factor BamA [Planctomycetes bacterium]|nr:outer membrane protein assembly factor BamA [Planctomycetota bacterium]
MAARALQRARRPLRGQGQGARALVGSVAHAPRALTACLRAALLLLALCASPAVAQDWDWAEGRTILEVEWVGLGEILPSQAESLISTRVGQAFDGRTLALDLARLYRSGRFGAQRPQAGPPVTVEVSESGTGVKVTFRISGERPQIRLIVLPQGVREILSEEELDRLVQTRAGSYYDPAGVERDVRALRAALLGKGYLFATVDHRAEPMLGGVALEVLVLPGPRVYVASIAFSGAESLDLTELLGAPPPDGLETRERVALGLLEDGVFSPAAFARDLDRIRRFYRSHGFLDVSVYEGPRSFSLAGDALQLEVRVEEGPRYAVGEISFEGVQAFPLDTLRRRVSLRPGEPFDGEALQQTVRLLRHTYGQQAYVHAVVEPLLDYDTQAHLMHLTFRVEEGAQVQLEAIDIEGNARTQDRVIRRELSLMPGQYFDADELEASLARLFRLRYFRDVRIDLRPGSAPGKERLVLRVDESRTGAILLGGGFSTNTGAFGSITMQWRNFDLFKLPKSMGDVLEGDAFNGAGQTLSIQLQPGRERSAYSVEFVEPWLFDTSLALGLQGSIRDRAREDWIEGRRTGAISLRYRLSQQFSVGVARRFERVHVGNIDAAALPEVVAVARTNYVSSTRLSLEYDGVRFDRSFTPVGGGLAQAYYEVADRFGGDFRFHRAGGVLRGNLSLFRWPEGKPWVLSLFGQFDWQRSLDSKDVPIFERFFAGGPGSLRGFKFRTVSPQLRNKPRGGNARALLGAEFSFPLLLDYLRGVVFLDAGAVTSDLRDLDVDALRLSAGAGLRLSVPGVFPAPVALDFGFPLRKLDDDDTELIAFSVGVSF